MTENEELLSSCLIFGSYPGKGTTLLGRELSDLQYFCILKNTDEALLVESEQFSDLKIPASKLKRFLKGN